MNLIVTDPHTALWGGRKIRCAVGKNGIVVASAKREGDGKTPAGIWPMRQVFYRSDRLPPPKTKLPMRATQPDDAWCDVDGDPKYNQLVKLPYAILDERLWRDDHLYDVVTVLGYNDAPILPGKGSAIFLHLARPDYSPSTGCVTLALEDFLPVLAEADVNTTVEVRRP